MMLISSSTLTAASARVVSSLASSCCEVTSSAPFRVGRSTARGGRIEDFGSGQHGIAVYGHGVLDAIGVATGIGHHHRNIARQRGTEDQLITLLQAFDGQP